ncbi:MAG TPA: hypothetical protein VIR34_00930, partial [Gemmatimonadaceae bacterium]
MPEPGQRAPGRGPDGEASAARVRSAGAQPATVRAATVTDISRVSEIEKEAFSDPWSRSAF